MKRFLIAFNMVIWSLVAVEAQAVDRETQIKECTAKGVRYFKELGSFPKLSDGRDATEVAKARCTRQPLTAFGS